MKADGTPALWLSELRARLGPGRERRLVWVQGPAAFTREWTRSALEPVDAGDLLEVGLDGVAPDQARQYLGREFAVLVWDARAGFHPDGFGALAGTLAGGGVLVLLSPPAREWPALADPDYARLAQAPDDKQFLRRLGRVLADHDSVLTVTSHQPLPPLPAAGAASPQPLPTADQSLALEAILRVRHGHRRRPLVLTADRGRGKSAVLGMAAARLVAEEGLKLVVTAPRPGALESFWRHARAGLENPVREGNRLGPGQGPGSIRFLPPADLTGADGESAMPEADLLLVDEAAAIPVPVLAGLLSRFARVVFATTVHGYEGSGRGFALRFQRHLAAAAPGWQALTLQQPVRWSANDPLEPLLNRLLLLNAELASPDSSAGATSGPAVEIVPWPRAARAEDEARLQQVFGLLVNAHYQTTPDDLRLLLDDPASRCWLALEEGQVVAALWLMAEGELPDALALDIRRGHRRTRGHLLPQSLAAYGGDHGAVGLSYWRIVRIAVHPQSRRQGLGRRLVNAAARAAGAAGIDVLGTSFGVEPGLLAFWRRCGLEPLRLGMRRDAASGAHSLLLGQGISRSGQGLCQRQRLRFAEHWPVLLATELQTLEPELVWAFHRDWGPETRWTQQDELEARDFAEGARPLGLSRLALQRLTWQQHNTPALILGDNAALWCRAVIQALSEEACQRQGLVRGRKACRLQLQGAARQLLRQLDGSPLSPEL